MSDDTPMMRQYKEMKARYPGAILFFRLGDFYEMFGDDARHVSSLLQLTLTQRGGVPMCGVPHHAAEIYLKKLLQAGKKIALCEQFQPSNKQGKALFERQVTEILTPGTLTQEELLGQNTAQYTISLYPMDDLWGVAAWDVATGEVLAGSLRDGGDYPQLQREWERLRPREVVLPEGVLDAYPGLKHLLSGMVREEVPVRWFTDAPSSQESLGQVLLSVKSLTAESFALSGLGRYLVRVLGHPAPHFSRFISLQPGVSLIMDASTLRNLELVESLTASGGPTLLQVLNNMVTAPGQRRLRRELTAPPSHLEECRSRLDKTAWFFSNSGITRQVRRFLENGTDLERILGRLKLDRATPADLGALGRVLQSALEVARILGEHFPISWDQERTSEWRLMLERAIPPEASRKLQEGPRLADGYHPELDRWRGLAREGMHVLEKVRADEAQKTGLPLKLKNNRMIGHYFELTRLQAQQIPAHFIRKQSLAGAERYTTQELLKAEADLAHADENAEKLEAELFSQLRQEASRELNLFQVISDWLTETDFFSGLGWLAIEKGWVKPVLDDTPVLCIVGGRHPVVEQFMTPGSYVPNDLELSPGSFFRLVTGPNMAGKSTYLRQNALILLLAHLGSYVPAESAVVGMADRVFCRVGASDNLARGDSTFMVEMKETAHILRSATPNSFVIMDEVGRGTGTQDGQALAWAVSEYILHSLRCRTLFSTHYHELTELKHPSLSNLHMAVDERGSDVVFLRKAIAGTALSSYGIHAARLGGIPESVLHRAQQLVDFGLPIDAPAVEEFVLTELYSPLELAGAEALGWEPDRMSPKEALDQIYELKQKYAGAKTR